MRLLNYLLKEEFKDSVDVDYPRPGNVIVFSKKAKYKKQGKTHGLLSHAIKHYAEFEPHKMEQLVDNVRKIIDKSKYWILDDSNNKIQPDDNFYPNDNLIINTMDFINDKIQMRHDLFPIEKQIKTVLNKLSKQYQSKINFIRNGSKDIDKLSYDSIKQIYDRKGIIKFSANSRGALMDYYYDFSNNSVLITYKDIDRTLFTVNNTHKFFKETRLFKFTPTNQEFIKFISDTF